jgi:hypothetical protein
MRIERVRVSRSYRVLLASSILSGFLPGPIRAQDAIQVPDTPVCADCLELKPVLSFGAADDEGALHTTYPAITRLPDGGWVVFEVTVGGTIRIYNPDGSFQRAIEAEGPGPGEYRGLSRLFSNAPDGYALYDPRNDRLSYVAEDFSFQSSVPFMQSIRIEALSNCSFVTNATLPGTAAQGHVVNVVDSTGKVGVSFGGTGKPVDYSVFHARHRVIAVGPDDGIWTGYMEKYELEKYDADGRLLVTLSRMADWFMPHSEIRGPRDVNSDPPNPKLRELTVDSEGLVWAVVWVADPNWKEGVPDVFDPYGLNDDDRVYDTILEAIDPANGKVLARTRSDFALKKVHMAGPLSGDPLYWSTVQQDDGFIRAEILRADLVRGGGPK